MRSQDILSEQLIDQVALVVLYSGRMWPNLWIVMSFIGSLRDSRGENGLVSRADAASYESMVDSHWPCMRHTEAGDSSRSSELTTFTDALNMWKARKFEGEGRQAHCEMDATRCSGLRGEARDREDETANHDVI